MTSKRKVGESSLASKKRPKPISIPSNFKCFTVTVGKKSKSKHAKFIELPTLVSHDSSVKIHLDELPNLIKIFELVLNYNQKKPDLYQCFVPLRNLSFRVPRKRDIFYSLLSCIVSKRYEKSAKFLIHLAVEKYGKDHIFFNASFRFMENSFNFSIDKVELFTRNIITLGKLNKREVVLELVMLKWRHNDFNPPRDIIQRISTYRNLLRKNHIIDILYAAYLSLYDYVSWVKCRPNLNEIGIETDQREEEGLKYKDRFIDSVSEIVSQDGIWDIFVIKIREMLEHYNELEKCEELLESYLYANLDHIHAHVYLYDFLRKQNRSFDKQRRALENIVKLSPSDTLALDYVQILITESNEKEAVDVLFNFLEYFYNKENTLAWELLRKIAFKNYKETDNVVWKSTKKNWKRRRSYWPIYHFDECTVDTGTLEKAQCAFNKCILFQIVASSSEDDLSYIEIVKDLLQVQYPKLFKKLKKKLQKIESF